MINREISNIDVKNLNLIRSNIEEFLASYGKLLDVIDLMVLDIAPQDHAGANPHFPKSFIETVDINPKSGATYIADICECNDSIIQQDTYDVVVCTEVLERTLNPFDAVKEIHRVLKSKGVALVSVPFNLRIHGPLPDCWRFTEHGLRSLFNYHNLFEIEEISPLEDTNRFLMPIHYTLVVRKNI